MKKKSSYRWLIWIILAVVLIGVALWNILSTYIDRWKFARDYDKLAEEYVNDESEPDDVPIGRICIAIVWVCHLLYFFLRVITLKPGEKLPDGAEAE